jgi:hypothetical protein
MKRVAPLTALLVLSACTPNFPEHPSADEVLAALDKPWIGQKGVEESFLENGDAEDGILAGICTASPRWLEVAHRMYDTGNAHFGEELSSALAVALTKEPKAVLEQFDDACSAPEDLPPACAVPDWRNAALQALRTVKDPALAATRQKCELDVSRSFIPARTEKEEK